MTNPLIRCGSEILSSEEMHAKSCKDEQMTWVGSFLMFLNPPAVTYGALLWQFNAICVWLLCKSQFFLLEGVYCIIYSSKLGNKMCSEVHKYNAVTVVLCVNVSCLFFQQLTSHAMCYTQP